MMDPKDYYKMRKEGIFAHVSFEGMKSQHKQNLINLRKAEEARKVKDRPIYILVLHGSGRHPEMSCAKEVSNSLLLAKKGLELGLNEWKGRKVEVKEIVLREEVLEVCNGCYSTSSALCNFSCSCWPNDSISTLIYPETMKADILFISTPVNQATAHSQVWNVMQRFISLDGGYYIEELPVKDQAFRSKAIQLEKEHPRYDPRLFGKIWGYFVSSKDTHNMKSTKVSYGEEKEVDILDPVLKKFDRMSYEYGTVGTLAYQAAEYGGFHAEPYYVISGSNPDIGMSSDKATLSKDASSFQEAKNVVLSALRMAESFIDKPPTLDAVDRINRS